MKKHLLSHCIPLLFFLILFFGVSIDKSIAKTEVIAWGNITGIRMES